MKAVPKSNTAQMNLSKWIGKIGLKSSAIILYKTVLFPASVSFE